jgi:ABC-type Fe3+-hydroxamate transport system substrate-binding protein
MDFPATITDQMGRSITLMQRPRRIISLVPSQTELLAHLGLDNEVAGITKFCIHPENWFRNKPRVGGTKNYDFEKIAELQPDLIIGNKEENAQGPIEQLMQLYPVWMSDIYTLSDALNMIDRIGNITGKTEQTTQLIAEITQGFSAIKPVATKQKAAYFIWRKPWMVAGHNTFINEMLQRCGFENVFVNETSRYPEITEEQLRTTQPDVLLFSSEPYPFKEQHFDELRNTCPNAKFILVDGEAFSWYGSRLRYSSAYFNNLTLALQ